MGASSCQKEAPKPPEIKFHYAILKAKEKVYCVEYEIQSLNPYTLGEYKVHSIDKCVGVNGYMESDFKNILNWIDELLAWANQKIQQLGE